MGKLRQASSGKSKSRSTVLRDLKLYGNFKISNNSSGLSVLKMNASDLESHFSWDIISKTTAVKQLDRSAFVHRGTGIPAEIVWFFDIGEDGSSASEHQVLIHQGKEYDVRIPLDNEGRYRLFWNADFTRPDTVQASHFLRFIRMVSRPTRMHGFDLRN